MIQSKQNEQIKTLKKLQSRKGRKKIGAYLIEGPHLVEEAINSQAPIKGIYYRPDAYQTAYDAYDNEEITEELAAYISETGQSQGVFAWIDLSVQTDFSIEDLQGPVIALDGVQDPGNLGTIIRTADALGYQQVLLGSGTVDLYNDKVLRSMQGSHFHLEVVQADLKTNLRKLQERGYYVLASALDDQAQSLTDYQPSNNQWVLVLGNEGQGVSESILALADQKLYIPMAGQAESFNVAVAAGILLYALA